MYMLFLASYSHNFVPHAKNAAVLVNLTLRGHVTIVCINLWVISIPHVIKVFHSLPQAKSKAEGATLLNWTST
jgi:hypothetical protein